MAGLHFDATYNNEDVMRKVRESQKAFTELANTAEAQGKRIDVAFEKISLKSLERVQEIMKSFPKEVQGISSFQKQVDELEKHIERVNQRIVSVGSGKLNPTLSDTSSNINIGDVLKQQVYVGAQSINTLTEKIIQQKTLIKDIENDVRTLGEAYRKAGAGTTRGNALFADFKGAKAALQEEKAALFDLQTQQAQARLSVRKLKDEQSLYQKETQKVVDSNNQMAVSFQKTLAAIGGTAMLKKFVSDVVKVRGEMQQIEVSLSTLLQNKEKADTLMSQIVKTAAETPFSVTELATGSKQLVAYGFQVEEVNDTLVRLGNIASGLGLPLERLTYLYGTTMTQGRLYARDLMQFTTSGIPMLQGLADMYGKSTDEVNKMVSAGKIGFPEVKKVIENLTDEGGKFFNLMQEQSKTLTGKISNLGDSWDEILNKIGQSNEGIINGSLDSAKYLVEHYEAVGKVLIGLISTFGAYKAAIIAYYAISKTYGVYDIATKELQFIATMKNIVATKALAVQQAILNKTALANPYVLVATLVVGAAAAMWALHDSTTAAEKAQRKFNDEQEKFNKQQEDRKRKIESLIQTIQEETETEYARIEAHEELQRYSPALAAAYSREELATLELAKSQKVLNEERDKTNYSSIISNVEKYTEYVNRLSKNGDKLRNVGNMYSGMVGEYGTNTTWNDRLELAKEDLKKWQEALNTYHRLKKEAEENSKPVEVKLLEAKSSRDEIVQEFAAAKFTFEEEQRKIKESGFGIIPIDVQIRFDNAKEQLSNIDKIIASLMGKSSQTYKEAYDTAKIEWKAAQKAFEESKKKSKAEYVAAKKDLDDKEKVFKDLGGVTNISKQESAADKLRKQQESIREQQDKNAQLDKKQSLDRQRQQQDLENQAAQAEIDALDDSFEKIEKQRILNNKKEIQSLERQKEDFINAVIQFEKEKFDAKENLIAKQNPKHVNGTFDPSTVKVNTSVFDGIIGNTSKKQLNDKVREQEDSWNEYLIKYGLFTQKKEAIDRKYKNLIEEASDAGKAATLQKEWDEALANLNLDKLKQDINWEVVFGDMSKVTKKQLQQVKKQLQEFKKSPEFKTSTPEQIKVIEEALNNINNALVDKGGFFGGLTDSLTEYEGTVYKVKEAQEELEKALKSGDEVAIEKAKKKKNAAEQNQANAQANVEKSKDKAIGNITAVSNAIVQLGKENVSLSDIGNTVGALVDTLSASGTKIGGIISAILSIIDAAGEVGTFQYGMDIIENISSTVTDAFARDTEAITGLDMSFMKSADYDDYNELVEEYGTLLDVWDQLLDKKKAYIKESYGAEVTKVGQEALDILNSEREITKELASSRLDAGKSAGSHSINYRMWKGSYDYNGTNWKDVAGDISKALGGVDFSNMWSMLNMSAEQLEWIKTNYTGLWANMDGDFRGYLDDIIKYGDTEKDIINSINEQLTQMSFDSLFDSFLNTLMDMDASSKDFADNFEEYMRKAIFTSMFAKNYEGALEDWYEAFAEANKKEGGITASDVKDLRNKWDDIVNGALSDREAWEQIVGSSGASTSQSSSQKGFAAMSQDTGEELNGRFTALQIAGEEIKNSMLSMLVSMNLISVTVGNNSITLTEIRNLAISSNSYLEDIAGYQKRIVNEFGNKLDSINSGIKQFNSK
ncbi:tape measure protein [Bacteroides thetaiotaomicron]|uniref:Tape measure domain n=1 Tax=Bacteroides thetaiotaomicron TaxID=818 RepID=A0A174UVV9_BACT4|nr:tape measure protein [Bacteroides thetaiotaomicron]CUQ24187.1 tape measure domain [Bacteroides thetaiotaomicron]